MKMRSQCWLQVAAAMAVMGGAGSAAAVPIVVNTPFFNLERRNINSLGGTAGNFVRLGATSVLPNGNAGTAGVAVRDLDGLTLTLNPKPLPVAPNFYQGFFFDNPALRGNWTLRFSNGADVTTAAVSLSPDATQAPFVDSITRSGSAATPTFSWAPPAGATVNAYRVNIYDKSLVGPGASGNIVTRNLAPTTTSYTVDPAHFSLPGYGFELGHNYSIEISLIQTKDGTSNASNANVQAIARSYADFTPSNSGIPNVNLPVVLANGGFQFNMAVQAGQTYYIDPDVAVGYDYAIGAGNPNFASVDLPDDIGDGRYDIYSLDAGGQAVLLAAHWDGHQVYRFASGGLSRFRVLGVEAAAGLDPADATAFVTGLTFTGSGQFTGTQTPLTAAVPEPASWALLGLGLLGLAGARRRRAAYAAAVTP